MIHWNIDPEIFSWGFIHIRYYSLMFLISFLLGIVIMKKIFRHEGKNELDVDDLLVYMMFGVILGARLGHVLFYDPAFYFTHPLEILMVWKGGLASHGAAIGIVTAIYYFSKKKYYNFLWLMDRIVIVVALSGSFIRLGNLFNSEIYGRATDLPWSFVFERIDNIPRHPTQIYESLAYLIIFVVLWKIYDGLKDKTPRGYLFGLSLVLIFGFRFFVEFLKAVQEPWEAGMALDMGQILSIPAVIIGVWLMISAKNRPFTQPKRPKEKIKGKSKK